MNVRRPNKNQVRVARQLRATLSGQETLGSELERQNSDSQIDDSEGSKSLLFAQERSESAKPLQSEKADSTTPKETKLATLGRKKPTIFGQKMPITLGQKKSGTDTLSRKVIRDLKSENSVEEKISPDSSRTARNWDRVTVAQSKKARFSKRFMAVLATVLISIAVVAPTLNSYIKQQEDKRQINAAIAEQQELKEALELEKQLWGDSQYVQSQARQRLGFVMPGQVLYKVLESELEGKQTSAQRIEEVISQRLAATPFFVSLWHSVELAGTQGDISNPGQTPLVEDTNSDAGN
ncbi:MAG: septum formation initiator family protein [Arcanobacterium sp.]|nr:septum formation initiator family protein [Arcanobacterium sp.]